MKKILILLTLLLFLSAQSIYAYDNKVNSIVNTKIISQEGQANKEDLILEKKIMTEDEYNKYTNEKTSTFIAYYNYEGLTEIIYNGLYEIKDEIDITDYCNTVDDTDFNLLMSYYFSILREYPEIFYGDNKVSVSYSYYPSSKKISACKLKIQYIDSKENIYNMKDEFNRKVNEIEESYLKNEDNKLKLQYIIHDYILSNTTYDYDNYVNGSVPKIAYNAYGALVEGVAVCEGYSKAAKLLMNLANIESGIIISPEMNHAWNYVNIDGSYYHMDITWDDSVPEKNRSIYNYFNLSDDEISKDHIWNSDIYPQCTNDKFNFLRINNSDNMARVDEKIYYFNNNNLYSVNLYGDNIKKEYSNINGRCLINRGNELFFIDENNVIKYNTIDSTYSVIYEANESINNIYIKSGKIYILGSKGEQVLDINISGDFNEDGVINQIDLSLLALRYGQTNSESNWNCIYDLNNDNIIDIFDITKLAKMY